jgi:ADP-ribose pyrophosphatase YjhB (NUDIX family)
MANPRAPVPRRVPVRRVEETSAGGFVVDRRGRDPHVALIARADRRGRLVWSLPKGHIEAGETPEQAAVREVHEETGITGSIVAGLGTIDFWFMTEDRRVHKTVHHFLLEAQDVELSDADAEVSEVAWVPLAEVASRLRYADERRLLDQVTSALTDPTGWAVPQ